MKRERVVESRRRERGALDALSVRVGPTAETARDLALSLTALDSESSRNRQAVLTASSAADAASACENEAIERTSQYIDRVVSSVRMRTKTYKRSKSFACRCIRHLPMREGKLARRRGSAHSRRARTRRGRFSRRWVQKSKGGRRFGRARREERRRCCDGGGERVQKEGERSRLRSKRAAKRTGTWWCRPSG